MSSILGPNTQKDHPRTRGEKLSISNGIRFNSGSPPHTRGKVLRYHVISGGDGITPAHAGKSERSRQSGVPPGDHPRTRGEKSYMAALGPANPGSPPHTRGKVNLSSGTSTSIGITPAHAGKRLADPITWKLEGDHPRTRGEKNSAFCNSGTALGSPPHTRGKVGQSLICPVDFWDHPRTRGEKFASISFWARSSGSPPHTRGKAMRWPARMVAVRITPAHAGKRGLLGKSSVG